jgi:hypothetical protein
MISQSVADIEGPWVETDWESGLVQRCRRSWNTPISELSNEMLATFLRQNLAVHVVFAEATKRLEMGYDDDSEIYDGELAAIVQEVSVRRARRTS